MLVNVPHMEQSWIIHYPQNPPYKFALQVPQSVQLLPAGAKFKEGWWVGFGGHESLETSLSIALSIVSAIKLAKK